MIIRLGFGWHCVWPDLWLVLSLFYLSLHNCFICFWIVGYYYVYVNSHSIWYKRDLDFNLARTTTAIVTFIFCAKGACDTELPPPFYHSACSIFIYNKISLLFHHLFLYLSCSCLYTSIQSYRVTTACICRSYILLLSKWILFLNFSRRAHIIWNTFFFNGKQQSMNH